MSDVGVEERLLGLVVGQLLGLVDPQHERRADLLRVLTLAVPDLDASLSGLGVDSLMWMELLSDVEDKLGILLPDDALELYTFGGLVRALAAALTERFTAEERQET